MRPAAYAGPPGIARNCTTNAHCGERGTSPGAADGGEMRFWLVVFVVIFLAFVMTGQYQSRRWNTRVAWWRDGGISVKFRWNLRRESGTKPSQCRGVGDRKSTRL